MVSQTSTVHVVTGKTGNDIRAACADDVVVSGCADTGLVRLEIN
jgi:hypothetical protein